MSLIVQKFGGTSVATKESRDRVIHKIIDAKSQGKIPVVVVSAMGRSGDPYATDTLIQIGKSTTSNVPHREMDLLMSCGEIISAVVITSALIEKGYHATALTGGQAGIVTDENYMQADIIEVKPNFILDLIYQGIIPVIAGFQGMSENGNITTFGRGGSDTSAAIIGEAIKAEMIEIYTDVDGIMTADPRICSNATKIEQITYNELFQMADSGAKVIHPRAVEVARRSRIPLCIKNTFSDTEGTYIIHYKDNKNDKKSLLLGKKEQIITGIAHRVNRVQFSILGDEINDEEVFMAMANQGVSIDIINIFPDRKVFTIDAGYTKVVSEILEKRKMEYSLIEDCCKITLIGERMTGVPGVMARIIKCLKKNGVSILQTADSLTTIACLVHGKDTVKAIETLHEDFELSH